MSYLVVKSSPSSAPESYQLTNTCNSPRLVVSDSYIPITTNGGNGIIVDDGSSTYKVMRTTTSSYSQSASATFLTSGIDSVGLSNTTALTRQSNYLTSAVNSNGLSSTTALGNNVYGGYIADTVGLTNSNLMGIGRVVLKRDYKQTGTQDTQWVPDATIGVGGAIPQVAAYVSTPEAIILADTVTYTFTAYYNSKNTITATAQYRVSQSTWGMYNRSASDWPRINSYEPDLYKNISAAGVIFKRSDLDNMTKTSMLYNVLTTFCKYPYGSIPGVYANNYKSYDIIMGSRRKSISITNANQTTISEYVSNHTLYGDLWNIYTVYEQFTQYSTTGYAGYSSKMSTSGYSGASSSSSSESASGTCWE